MCGPAGNLRLEGISFATGLQPCISLSLVYMISKTSCNFSYNKILFWRQLLPNQALDAPKAYNATAVAGDQQRSRSTQLKLNGFRHSGQVLALLVLNHFSKQLEWNKFLHVGQRLVGSCLSALMME